MKHECSDLFIVYWYAYIDILYKDFIYSIYLYMFLSIYYNRGLMGKRPEYMGPHMVHAYLATDWPFIIVCTTLNMNGMEYQSESNLNTANGSAQEQGSVHFILEFYGELISTQAQGQFIIFYFCIRELFIQIGVMNTRYECPIAGVFHSVNEGSLG